MEALRDSKEAKDYKAERYGGRKEIRAIREFRVAGLKGTKGTKGTKVTKERIPAHRVLKDFKDREREVTGSF